MNTICSITKSILLEGCRDVWDAGEGDGKMISHSIAVSKNIQLQN